MLIQDRLLVNKRGFLIDWSDIIAVYYCYGGNTLSCLALQCNAVLIASQRRRYGHNRNL